MTRNPLIRFVWHDLVTTDPEAAAAFYGGVLGWTWERPGDGAWRVAHAGDHRVAGLLPIGEGASPHWLCHVAVDDPAQVCRRLAFLQGQVLLPPDAETGGTAVAADPAGAVFGIVGGEAVGDESPPGAVAHHELLGPRPDLGARVYRTLLGWTAGPPVRIGTGDRISLSAGGRPVATLSAWPSSDAVPPQWVPYVRCADLAGAVARARAAGATLLDPDHALPGQGAAALLSDPQGAVFGLLG